MPISPDTDYSLMGSVECLQMTADIYHGAFASELDVDAITDGTSYRSFAPTIEQAVLLWYETASLEHKAYMAVHGFMDIPLQLNEATKTVINCLTEAMMMQTRLPAPWTHHQPIELGHSYIEAIDRLFVHWKLDRWAWKLGEQYLRSRAVMQQFRDSADLHAALSRVSVRYGCNVSGTLPKQIPKPARKLQRRARRAINRGIRSFERHLGLRDLQAFISAGKVTITGAKHRYALTNYGNIVSHTMYLGHGVPFGLDIVNDAGVKLASACVYLPDTPIIDQILALALNVKDTESEIEFLQKAAISYVDATIQLEGVSRKSLRVPERLSREAHETWYHEREAVRSCLSDRWQTYIEDCLCAISEIPRPVWDVMMLPRFEYGAEIPAVEEIVRLTQLGLDAAFSCQTA